jgi:hypothetical protein
MSLKNANYFRNLQPGFDPSEFGLRLAETLQQLDDDRQTLAQQTNSNTDGRPQAPPAIGGLTVRAQNGHFDVAITDRTPIYAGINYFLMHADNPHFSNPTVIDMGQTRNHNLFLGNVTRYFAAYSSYQTSLPSQAVYHGGTKPAAVVGGGSVGGPAFQSGQGTGTSGPGVGLEGPGIAPFRSTTGAPPKR